MKQLKEIYRQFQEWKQQPPMVAPLSEQQHECTTCGTHYQGNYCPRCGQSAKIGRYSFKNALLLFLDVWGLGNRGMFRSIRDLLLRPGYMIRDYLGGMQMAYFPPFKMYFLLFALTLLVDTGLNIKGINRMEEQKKESLSLVDKMNVETQQAELQEDSQEAGKTLTKEEEKEMEEEFNQKVEASGKWFEEHYSIVIIISLLLFSCPLWLLFRRCPALPDIRLSECFVAMVYISNMLLIYSLIPSLFCFNLIAEMFYGLLILPLVIIPVKQLSGYSYWGTIWRLTIASMSLLIVLILLLFVAIVLYIMLMR